MKGRYPCNCGKPAVVEKAGQVLCADCRKAVKGREYPLRTGEEYVANYTEKNHIRFTPAQKLRGDLIYT